MRLCSLLRKDPTLLPYRAQIEERLHRYQTKKAELTNGVPLTEFANGYLYFGIRRTHNGWVYREWAPGADEIYFTGDFNGWNEYSHPMKKLENGVFEITLSGADALREGQHIQALVHRDGKTLRRIPLYATRVEQDKTDFTWCATVEDTFAPFPWTDAGFSVPKTLFIYECHIGMATEEYKVGSYKEFRENVLPRVIASGYNTLQIMAIMEHPYYGSFGYQVSNFFACSSRYGTSSELKELINACHAAGIAVLLDVVHSHAIKNTAEGINEFDGTKTQFFRAGDAGEHPAWGTKLFDYGKNEVLHFLLSNLKYWMDVFHFDGFRFDGVTSMLYHDHGLGRCFTCYDDYFTPNTDTDAVVYLQLANQLIHEYNAHAVTVAEDMSGMPGIGVPVNGGGLGFDYRLSMGVPDLWIQLLKEYSDENWDLWKLWYELTNRRAGEKTVGYCESHDQALVGDKTIMFRLCDAAMYTGMDKESADPAVDRGVALHKMIRLLTATTAGEGYLNFMGNEFGHPEWIDFPREGNNWSHHYCRRQWSLEDNGYLRYGLLAEFDREMLSLCKRKRILSRPTQSLWIGQNEKTLIYAKGKTVFAFNFHPTESQNGYFIPTPEEGAYKVCLSSDEKRFGGFARVDMNTVYHATVQNGRPGFLCYLPARTATVFEKKGS